MRICAQDINQYECTMDQEL